MKPSLLTAFLLCASASAAAAPVVYRPVALSQKISGIHFKLPYSMGTHDGDATALHGSVKLDLNQPESAVGVLRVPIASITTDHATRDCHLREALGLKYEGSKYPESHVCNDDDRLPTSGADAVVYPEIELKVSAIKSLDPSGRIQTERETPVQVIGSWLIHGVTRPAQLSLKVIPDAGKFRLRGETPISLKAYGVEVKSARIAFVTISVEDQARVAFDLLMEPESVPAKK